MPDGEHEEPQRTLEQAHEFLRADDGSLITEDRFRDFVVSRSVDENEETAYTSGEIWLPPETLDTLHGFLAEQLKKCLNDVQSYQKPLRRYGVGIGDQDFTEFVERSEIPLIDQQESLLTEIDLPDTTYEEPCEPDFQAIRVMDRDGKIILGLQYYYGSYLLGDNNLVNLRSTDNEYVPLDDPIIAVPAYLDAIYYDGYIFVLNRWQFEQMFGYKEEYERLANEVLDVIEDNDFSFDDPEFVRDTVLGNINLLRTIRNVESDDLYSRTTPSRAKTIIDNYNFDGINYQEKNGELEISVSDKKDVSELIKIFNDGHLESPIFDRKYQVGTKEQR